MLCTDAVIASVPASAFTGRSASEINSLAAKVAAKVANATEVRHDVSYGVDFRCYAAGITDRFEVAALAVTIGAVNPTRLRVVVKGETIGLEFNASGLSPDKARKEAAATFSKVAEIISHKLMMKQVS